MNNKKHRRVQRKTEIVSLKKRWGRGEKESYITHSLPCALSLTHSLIHTHTHTHTHTHVHTLTRTPPSTHTLPLSHTHTYTHTPPPKHTHIHTHTRTHIKEHVEELVRRYFVHSVSSRLKSGKRICTSSNGTQNHGNNVELKQKVIS
jgi:hypothetical protein